MEQAKALAESAPTMEQLANLTPDQLGLSPLQFQALQQLSAQREGGIGGYKPFLERAGQSLDRAEGVGALSTGIFDPTMVDQFMNPYQKAVTEQALSQLNKQFAEQQAQRGASAVGAGAFGGARSGVVEGIAQRELGDVASRRIFEDLARNFGQAQQSAMTSFENQQRRLANQAGLVSNIAGQQAEVALRQAGLGELAQKQALTDADALLRGGQVEQQQRLADEQARVDRERFAFLEPQQRLSFYSDILRGVPSTQIQTLTGPGQQQVPLFQQALGAGITGLGLYGAGSKLGIF
jgi:hypothetical protein